MAEKYVIDLLGKIHAIKDSHEGIALRKLSRVVEDVNIGCDHSLLIAGRKRPFDDGFIQIGWAVEQELATDGLEKRFKFGIIALFVEMGQVLRDHAVVGVYHKLGVKFKHIKGGFWLANFERLQQVGICLGLL